MRNLQVNRERLWASLMALAEIGATAKGGVCRLAASDLDGEARRRFIQWCEGWVDPGEKPGRPIASAR
jgi:N-carbamoyl-L-amino-acid hydrolase